jgi:hypothetical protein
MSLVRVWTDVGARKPVALLAKIVEKDGVIFTIRYLSECEDKIWRYEEDTYEIDDDSIAEHLNTDHEDDIGFVQAEDGFVKMMGEEDDDYVPTDEDDDSEESTDDDEDEEEEDEFEEEDEEELEESDGEEV